MVFLIPNKASCCGFGLKNWKRNQPHSRFRDRIGERGEESLFIASFRFSLRYVTEPRGRGDPPLYFSLRGTLPESGYYCRFLHGGERERVMPDVSSVLLAT